MKRPAAPHPRSRQIPIAWRDTGYAALRANAADTFDDRVSDDLFDIDDERAEVDLIVNGMTYRLN